VVDDILCGGLGELGIEQSSTTSLREFLSAGATAQQADTVRSIHLPDAEIVRPGAAKQLAFSIDTGESVQVGSLHEDLLENS
jgi:hypothetical protein